MEPASQKRKAGTDSHDDASSKRPKSKKQWETTGRQGRQGRHGTGDMHDRREIQPGDSGIWATCTLGKEGKCVGDLKALFEEYAQRLFGTTEVSGEEETKDGDVEAEIEQELKDIRNPKSKPLFTSIRLDTPCVVFFRTRPPVEPVSFVRTICEDVHKGSYTLHFHSVKRLTPMTLIGKATEHGLHDIARQVLAPHFHQGGSSEKKFAIRPNLRNHSVLTRDLVIKLVAQAVGPDHKVSLKEFDLLILVEVYQNVCGVSVVGGDFDAAMKRFNLDELASSSASKKLLRAF